NIMRRQSFYRALLVFGVIFGLLIFSGDLLAQGYSGEAFERVKKVQERHTARFMEMEGIEGTAIGLNQHGQPSVKVFVSRFDVVDIPVILDGAPVQLIFTGKIFALKKPSRPPVEGVDPTARFDRPVPIGVSTGHPAVTAGTIGCRVIDIDENVYALSNNHVYANENLAEIELDNVLQPGTYDGGVNPDDAIGTLSDFEPIVFSVSANNTIDAAIALSSIADLDNATPSDGYGTPKSTTIVAAVGMPVKKYGRTTGQTKGRVYAVNATVDIVYDSGVARFVNQIIITPGSFSAGGDSGSLIVFDGRGRTKADDRKPVGLLFAGSDLVTIANPINAVLDRFGVAIDEE
ncbi:MAG: hypothetical protein ACMUIM_03680, partial [bacterium]